MQQFKKTQKEWLVFDQGIFMDAHKLMLHLLVYSSTESPLGVNCYAPSFFLHVREVESSEVRFKGIATKVLAYTLHCLFCVKRQTGKLRR